MKSLVVIPARGGSKRIPKKNIKNFYGEPIIAYSLKTAKQSGVFDCIHVSTEDEEIFEIVSQLGFTPEFYRSRENASDEASIRDVLRETLNEFEKRGIFFDIIGLLSATAPLIGMEDIKNAFQLFQLAEMKYPMLAVAKYPVAVEWALKLDASKEFIEPLDNSLFFASSHGFQDTYYDIGSFAFFAKQHLFGGRQEIKFIPYVMPRTKSVDVDNIEDWNELEKMYLLLNPYQEK